MKTPWSPEGRDPWLTERAKCVGHSLVRIIDLERGMQEFKVLFPKRGSSDVSDMLIDGCTLIKAAQPLDPREIPDVMRHYDELWRADHEKEKAAAVEARRPSRLHGRGG
jgi:hypothetical protein